MPPAKSDAPKAKKVCSPEQLERLAAMREKASAARAAIKQATEEERLNVLQAKIDKIKKTPTPKEPKEEPKEEPAFEDTKDAPSIDAQDEKYSSPNGLAKVTEPPTKPLPTVTETEEPAPPTPAPTPAPTPKKKSKSKKPIVIMQQSSDSDSDSDDNSNVIYIKKKASKKKDKNVIHNMAHSYENTNHRNYEPPPQRPPSNPFFNPMIAFGRGNFT